MDALKRIYSELNISMLEQAKLSFDHGIKSFASLKAKRHLLEGGQLDKVDKAVQSVVASVVDYLDSLQCPGDPLQRFSKEEWENFLEQQALGVDDCPPQIPRRISVDTSSGDKHYSSSPASQSHLEKTMMPKPPPLPTPQVQLAAVTSAEEEDMSSEQSSGESNAKEGSMNIGQKRKRLTESNINDGDKRYFGDQERHRLDNWFDLIPQGFHPSSMAFYDNEEEPEPKVAVVQDLAFVDFQGRRFKKIHCYSYITPKGKKGIVGIQSFRSKLEANCVRIVRVEETFLGHGDLAEEFIVAIKELGTSGFVQIRGIKPIPLCALGDESPDLDAIPKLIYEPQVKGKRQSFGYVLENDGSNLVRVPRREVRVVESFAGAGGMHLGFEAEGYTTTMAIEKDKAAMKTFQHNNLGVPVYEGGISEFLKNIKEQFLGRTDVVQTSSPCQDYSRANHMLEDNEESKKENALAFTHVDLLRETGALVGIFENMEGMWSENGMPHLKKILIDCIKMRYQVRVMVLRPCDYGDPQKQPRLVIFTAKDFVMMPHPPTPTHGPGRLNPYVTTKDVLEYLRTPLGRGFDNMDVRRTTTLQEGDHGCIKLNPNDLPPVIHASGPPVLHYDDESRDCISVREAAALQSFPYTYKFFGTMAEQYEQVGNAVPVEFARALARTARESLRFVYQEEAKGKDEESDEEEEEEDEDEEENEGNTEGEDGEEDRQARGDDENKKEEDNSGEVQGDFSEEMIEQLSYYDMIEAV